jgi:DNA (cytosine-5)-methyltransferase 1
MIKHLDLFSGIGGFALAVDRVFGKSEHIFVENDPFCQLVLSKHWPKSYIHGDIKTFTNTRSQESSGLSNGTRKEISASRPSNKSFLLTGGFPCQPFSQAGRRRGTEDDRYLWPEMLRVICDWQPTWVIAENVRGLLTQGGGVVFEQVCLDLESAGYQVQPIIIPAVAVNAPHRRDRVWFIAHRNDAGSGASQRRTIKNGKENGKEREYAQRRADGQDFDVADARRQHGRKGGNEGMETSEAERSTRIAHAERCGKNAADAESERHERFGKQSKGIKSSQSEHTRNSWERSWLEVATRLCGVFNGFSTGLDKDMSDGIYLKHAKTAKQLTRQNVPCLWKGFQSQAFQWRIGRFDTIQDKAYVFTALWKLSGIAKGQDDLSFESAIVQEAYVRNVWHDTKLRCPPYRWGYKKQYFLEHKDALSQLSHEVALVAAEIKEAHTKNRNPRLKALGNAIVPAVAEEILKAIKSI